MAKAFSLASWNVEHFRGDSERVDRIVNFLLSGLPGRPDVFALFEVEGKTVFEALTTKMGNYTFHITEGDNTQQILVGVRSGLGAFVSQRTEYSSGVFKLRPGMLATITVEEEPYAVLFMNTKSGDYPRDLGLRDDMFERAFRFRNVLDRVPAVEGKANYLFLGDFNTMGMKYRYNRDQDIEVAEEFEKLENLGRRYSMTHLVKDEPFTFWNGSESSTPASDLDHVFASDHLSFRPVGGAAVTVQGWPKEESVEAKDRWIADYSDHAVLYLEVQKVGDT